MKTFTKRFDRIDLVAVALFSTLAAAALLAGALPEQKDATNSGTRVVAGETVSMGNGKARSWVRVDAAGNPAAVGVSFDEAALTGLPNTANKLKDGSCCDGPEFAMDLPSGIAGLPFTHVVINWNPKGHEPMEIYGKPHFDFHFYMMPAKQRTGITADGKDFEITTRALPANQIPEGYILAPGGVPRMGAHWANTASPEFNGQPFTKTFIYGSYDGQLAFVEPMMTLAYLQTKPNTTEPIKTPSQYPVSGYYPHAYRVAHDPATRQYSVSLEDLTKN